MYVCAGCRPRPLGYAMIDIGDHLDEMVHCPRRDLCTWYAAQDLGGTANYTDTPTDAMLPVAFKQAPYFSCDNFSDHDKFRAAVRRTQQRVTRERASAGRAAKPARTEA